MSRGFRVGLLAAALMTCSMYSVAQHNPAGTAAERAQLPPFCAVKLKDDNRSPAAQRWIAQFGFDNWLHVHHYCYGKVFMLRASAAGAKRDQDYQRSLAIKEYSYVLNASKPDFWMRPQIHLEIGRIQQSLGQFEEAIASFGAAVRANPRYQAAYLALIAALRSKDQRADALSVAQQGVRYLPDSADLKKSYFDLGGREPLPRPAESAQRNTPIPDTNGQPAPQETQGQSSASDAADEGEEGASVTPVQQGPSDAADPVGPSEGRSCRFCPPTEIEERWRENFQK